VLSARSFLNVTFQRSSLVACIVPVEAQDAPPYLARSKL
jgi:hypothetical protein